MPRAICNFAIGLENLIVPLTNLSVTKLKYFSLPILSAFTNFELYFSEVLFLLLCLLRLPLRMGRTHPQLLFKSLHI